VPAIALCSYHFCAEVGHAAEVVTNALPLAAF
jgi:hypothetical protein